MCAVLASGLPTAWADLGNPLVIEVVPVNWQVTSVGYHLRDFFDKERVAPGIRSEDPFADLGGATSDLPPAVPVTLVAPNLDEGEWFDLKAAMVDANPDWPPLPDDARFLVNRTQGLLYAAAPEAVLADVRRLPELIQRDFQRYWRVTCAVAQMKPDTFERTRVFDLDLLESSDVEPVVTLFPTGVVGQACEQSMAREAVQAKVRCEIAAEEPSPEAKRLSLDLRFELRLGELSFVAELADIVTPGRPLHRVLERSEESVLVLISHPELFGVEPFPTEAEILGAKEWWREVAGELAFAPIEDPEIEEIRVAPLHEPEEDNFAAFAVNAPPGFITLDPSFEDRPIDDPFADLDPRVKELLRFELPGFEHLLGTGPFVDARWVLENAGIDFPPGACAIFNTKSWRLFLRNRRSRIDLAEVYFSGGGYSVAKTLLQQFSFVECIGTDSHRLLFSVGNVTRSGVVGRSTMQYPGKNPFLDLQVDPVIGADGITLEGRIVIEGRYQDSAGAIVNFTQSSTHIYYGRVSEQFPILAVAGNQLDCHVYPEIRYPKLFEDPFEAKEVPGLSDALERAITILNAEGRLLP